MFQLPQHEPAEMKSAPQSNQGIKDVIPQSGANSAHGRKRDLIDVTPSPILTRFIGFYDWMTGGMKMLGGMLVLRAVTATHMAAGEAEAKMNPFIPGFHAFLAPVGARSDGSNLVEMSATFRHGKLLRKDARMEN